jgi:uncharacterized protein (TIGR02594 family)
MRHAVNLSCHQEPAMTTTHTVQRGDTLSAIAHRHGLDVDTLARANGMNPALADGHVSHRRSDPDLLLPGQQLRIPSATPGYEASHTVGAGESLGRIAERWNLGVDQLLAANPEVGAVREGGRINLQDFLNPARGSNAPAAIVIGNAEGTRTPGGGTTAAYGGHRDPGNRAHNQGSFSYQHGAASPQAADRAQLQRLAAQLPAYEAAARAAGLDPNNARLASAYFDLFNQSPTAAARFLQQMPRLAGQALTPERLVQARVDAFVNPETGRRFTNPNGQLAGGGFANIARERLGRAPSEAEVQQTIRADQQRRTRALDTALQAQGLLDGPAATTSATHAAAPGPAHAATHAGAGSAPWLEVAKRELGTQEMRGSANNPRVLAYHATTSLHARNDETAWCSAFVNWTMQQAGYQGTGSAAARSWSTWGQAVQRDAQHVRPGDVIVFPRGSNPAQGHVAIVSEVRADGSVVVIGGNQSTRRGEGDGVTESVRLLSDAVAVRRPTEAQRR